MTQPEKPSKPGRIITFYSYKGGVGRSFALANVAAILAKWGAKVLCVDWDLEAPGLHHFFPDICGKEARYGLLHLLESASAKSATGAGKTSRTTKLKTAAAAGTTDPKISWRDCLNRVQIGATGKQLDLIVAGREADDYIRRVHDFNWQALYGQNALGEFLENLRQEWAQDYDFVLLDSRTGLTDIGGVCTIHLPDIVVTVFTANHQSMGGTAFMAERINEQRRDFFYSSGQAIIMPLLSRWEEKDAPEDAKLWLPRVLKTLRPSFNTWRHDNASVDRLAELLKIPYKAKWNFGERLAVLEESETDPGSVSYHLHLITAVLVRDFAETDVLASTPEAYVGTASAEAPNKRVRMHAPRVPPSIDAGLENTPSASPSNYEAILTRKLDLLNRRNAPRDEIVAIINDINELRSATGRPLLNLPGKPSAVKNVKTASTVKAGKKKSAPSVASTARKHSKR